MNVERKASGERQERVLARRFAQRPNQMIAIRPAAVDKRFITLPR